MSVMQPAMRKRFWLGAILVGAAIASNSAQGQSTKAVHEKPLPDLPKPTWYQKADPRVQQGIAAFAQGDYDAASKEFARAASQSDDDTQRLAFGRATAKAAAVTLNKEPSPAFVAAITEFEKIASGSTSAFIRARAHYNRGNLLFGAERFDEAVSAYQKALLEDHQFVDARSNLEIALRKRKQAPPSGDNAKAQPGPGAPQATPPSPQPNQPSPEGNTPPNAPDQPNQQEQEQGPDGAGQQAQPPQAPSPSENSGDDADAKQPSPDDADSDGKDSQKPSASRDLRGRDPRSSSDSVQQRLDGLEKASRDAKREAAAKTLRDKTPATDY